MPEKDDNPKYLFDLHSVLKVFQSGDNHLRDEFITGLQSGSIKVLRSLAKELSDIDEIVYREFQSVRKGRVYIDQKPEHVSLQAMLMDRYGTNIFGGSPRSSSFHVVATCLTENLILVTDGRPLVECRKIVSKCCSGKPSVLSVNDFTLEVMLS